MSRPKKLKEMDLILVNWLDARVYGRAASIEELKKDFSLCEFNTVGFFVLNDGKKFIMASDVSPDGEYRDINVIPTSTIVSVTILEKAGTIKV